MTGLKASPVTAAGLKASPVTAAGLKASPVTAAGLKASPVTAAGLKASPVTAASLKASPVTAPKTSPVTAVKKSPAPGLKTSPLNGKRSVGSGGQSSVQNLFSKAGKAGKMTDKIEVTTAATEVKEAGGEAVSLGLDSVARDSPSTLTNVTAKRVKAPKRRPPSSIFLKENVRLYKIGRINFSLFCN